jgi:moderate conductance mechanosensitive channel
VTDLPRDPLGNPQLAAQWLADNWANILLGLGRIAGNIAIILVVAFVVRYLTHRAIDRFTRGASENRVPTLLRPLRERAPDALGPLVSERRAQRARTIGSVLKSLTSFVVYGLAFIEVLRELGIDLAPILASVGVVGVALGFGAQNLVKDFISGVFMMLEDQYGVGDVVDLGPASGTIESVGLRVTTLRDVNGTVWYVRNGTVQRVGNSSQGFAVAVVDVPLAYSVNLERANQVLATVAEQASRDENLVKDVIEPAEVLGVEKVTAETITLRLTAKVRPGRQWAVQRKLRARIMAGLDDAGIEPPLGRTSLLNGTTTATASPAAHDTQERDEEDERTDALSHGN